MRDNPSSSFLTRGFARLAALAGLLSPASAWAQATTVGEVMNGAHSQFVTLLPALSAGCYVAGVAMTIGLLQRALEYSEAPGQKVKGVGLLMRSIGIAALFQLPQVLSVLRESLFKGVNGFNLQTSVSDAGGGEGLDTMLVHMVRDVTPALGILIGLIAFTSGIFMIVSGITALSNQQYQQDQVGKRGIFVRFGVGTALTTFAPAVSTILATMFDTTTGTAMGTLAYSKVGLDAADAGHIDNVFNAIFAWLSVIGLMAILRGLWVLYGSLEGNKGPGSLMAPMTHLIAGAALVNIVPALRLVETTLGCGDGAACQILNG